MKWFSILILLGVIQTGYGQEPFNQNGQWGIKKGNQWILEPSYDLILPEGDYFRVKKEELYGLANSNGKLIIDPKYSSLYLSDDKYLVFAEGGRYNPIQGELVDAKYGLMDLEGKILIKAQFHRIYMSHELLNVQVSDNWGNWGVLDPSGKVLLDAIYESFSFDMRPHSPIEILNKSYVKIRAQDEKSHEFRNLFTDKFRKVGGSDFWGPYFIGEHALVYQDKGVKVIDMSGKQVGNQYFYKVKLMKEGHFLARPSKSHAWSLYNANGKKQTEINHLKEVIHFQTKYGLVKTLDGKYGVMNTSGELLFLTEDTLTRTSSDGFYILKKGRLNHIINHEGKALGKSMSIKIEDYFADFNLLKVQGHGKGQSDLYRTPSGKKINNYPIRYLKSLDEFLYCETAGSANFFINKEGGILGNFSPRFEIASDYRSPLNGLKDVTSGKWLVKPKHLYGHQINSQKFYFNQNRYPSAGDTITLVEIKNKLVDQKKYLIKGVVRSDERRTNYALEHEGKLGMINDSFELVLPFDFDEIELDDQSIWARKGEHTYTYTTSGKLIAQDKTVNEVFEHCYMLTNPLDDELYYLTNKDGLIIDSGYFSHYEEIFNGDFVWRNAVSKKNYLLKAGDKSPIETNYLIEDYLEPDQVGGKGAYLITNGKHGMKRRYGIMTVNAEVLMNPKSKGHGSIDGRVFYFTGKKDVLITNVESPNFSKTYPDIRILYKNCDRNKNKCTSVYAVKETDFFQIYDDEFKPLFETEFRWVQGFAVGTFLVFEKDRQYALVNKKGENLLPKKYALADSYDDMIACINEDGTYDIFDSYGDPIVDHPVDDYAFEQYYAEFGMIEVSYQGNKYLYDYNGKLVVGPVDEFFKLKNTYLDEEYIGYKMSGKVGYTYYYQEKDSLQNVLYDEMKFYEFENDYVRVKQGEFYGVLEVYSRKAMLPIKYDKIEFFKIEDDQGNVGLATIGNQSWKIRYDMTLEP